MNTYSKVKFTNPVYGIMKRERKFICEITVKDRSDGKLVSRLLGGEFDTEQECKEAAVRLYHDAIRFEMVSA